MKETKDNFTVQSGQYARYRPTYPPALFIYLASLVNDKTTAWDCGTGNGQVALELSRYFQQVYATDISAAQLEHATRAQNIQYIEGRAEQTAFPNNSFDLITVAQAIHWFDFDAFYKEVRRTIKAGGILAILGYGLLQIDDETDRILGDFYSNTVGPYWDKERKYLDEHYKTIPFPFKELVEPVFENEMEWTLETLAGYLDTWSAVQHYIRAMKQNPVQQVITKLEAIWPAGELKKVHFPILLRVARIEK